MGRKRKDGKRLEKGLLKTRASARKEKKKRKKTPQLVLKDFPSRDELRCSGYEQEFTVSENLRLGGGESVIVALKKGEDWTPERGKKIEEL